MEIRHLIKFAAPLVLLFFSSCYLENKPVDITPDNLFSKEKMILVMTDIQLVEGALNYNRITKRGSKELKEPYYNQIFLEHNITAKDFKQNLAYYNMRPEVMEQILDKVLENTNQNLGQLEKRITEERIADSLRKIKEINDSLNLLLDSLPTNK